MNNKKEGMILGGFVSDAFSLAPHWIYNVEQINQLFGNLENIIDLPINTYHKTKKKGDFTHYGDQMFWLLQFLKKNSSFDNKLYVEFWIEKMTNYQGYIDHASRESLKKLKQKHKEEGSSSTDISGAVMIGPLIYFNKGNENRLQKDIKAKIRMTHNNELVLETGNFMTEVVLDVLKGQTPVDSITKQLKKLQLNGFINKSFEKAKKLIEEPTQKAIGNLGQACGINSALPATFYILLKYQDDFKKAIIKNAKAGGDSAARGIMIGSILGAYHGIEGIPKRWLTDMNAYSEILRLLS